MPKPLIKHYGRVMNLRLNFHNKALWYQQLGALEGKEFELTVKQKHKKVSNDQYSYYFGAILTTCHDTELFHAFDKPADIHTYFEYKFLTEKKMMIVGEEKTEIPYIRKLEKLTMKEMSEFIDRCLHHCRDDLKILILTPEEYYTENYTTIRK